MITRLEASKLIDKLTATIWMLRDEFLQEEPRAADRFVVAVLELKNAEKDILRLLPEATLTKETGTEQAEPVRD